MNLQKARMHMGIQVQRAPAHLCSTHALMHAFEANPRAAAIGLMQKSVCQLREQ